MLLVDTNVVFALLVRSTPFSEAAQALYGRDDDWRSESHALVELTNVLTRYVRAKLLGSIDAATVLRLAEERFRTLTAAHSDALNSALRMKTHPP